VSADSPEPFLDANSVDAVANDAAPEHAPFANEPSVFRWAIVVGAGVFATTMTQPNVLRLPFQNLLKTDLHVSREVMASFFALATLAWNFKPVAGIFTDTVPLFGSRRKYYIVTSSLLAGALFLAVGIVPRTYTAILVTIMAMSCMAVVASTVVGGLAVEVGQRDKATGRITSARYVVMNACTLIGGPLGGFLAARAFGYTAITGALIAISVVPFALWFIKEPPIPQKNKADAWADTKSKFRDQFKTLLHSRPLWIACGLLALIYISPGFSTPLYYYQVDTLKLSQQFIGTLALLAGAFGIVGALLYAVLCRKLSLRALLYISIIISTIGTACYVFYRSGTAAAVIESENGFLGTIAELALMDLASRATPKGSEGLGFALMMSVRNGCQSLSDIFGSYIIDHHILTFFNLVWLNAGTTAIIIVLIPFLPKLLTDPHDS
jgi:MFS family permease